MTEPGELMDMDMITQLEIEQAVKTRQRVDKRVLEVAIVIQKMKEPDSGQHKWQLGTWNIDLRNYEGDEAWRENNQVQARIYYYTWDDDDYDDYADRKEIMRQVMFPRRYLWTTDWVADAEKRIAEGRRRMAAHQAEMLEARIPELEKEIENARAKIAEYRKQAEEPQ